MVIPQEYNVYTQAQIVAGLAIIHNFIWIYDLNDIPEDDSEDNEDEGTDLGRLQS